LSDRACCALNEKALAYFAAPPARLVKYLFDAPLPRLNTIYGRY
jgi:hypothetical protein